MRVTKGVVVVTSLVVLTCVVGPVAASGDSETDNTPWTPSEILELCDGTDNLPCEEDVDPRACE